MAGLAAGILAGASAYILRIGSVKARQPSRLVAPVNRPGFGLIPCRVLAPRSSAPDAEPPRLPDRATVHGSALASRSPSPRVSLPLRQELGHPALQVLRVCDDLNLAGFLESLESADGPHHLHLVVCALRLPACQDSFLHTEPQDAGPTPASGVAEG